MTGVCTGVLQGSEGTASVCGREVGGSLAPTFVDFAEGILNLGS